MAIHGVVRTDNMSGTDVRADLVSIEYIVTDSSSGTAVDVPTDIDNGNVLKVGALIDREVFKGTTTAANDALDDIVLIATPEMEYDPRLVKLSDFYNKAGIPARGYRLRSGNIFSVTAAALAFATNESTDGKVGSVVELKAGTKMNVVAASTGATSGSTVVGEIIAIETVSLNKYYVIRVA